MSDTDLYAVLGVSKTADADAIKKAFRASAMKFHPDRNPGDKKAEDSFKKVNHAYEVLSDPKKRALYDEFGEVGLREGFDADRFRQWQNAGAGGGGASYEDFFGQGAGGNVDFGDIFSQFFGGAGGGGARVYVGGDPGGRTRRQMKGRDLEGEITVDFADAVRGHEVGLNVNGNSIRVRIPPGAKEGARVRVGGKGVPSSSGGPPGDLLLTVHVTPHASYWLEDEDLHVRVPVTVIEAWKGAKVTVPTPTGEVAVKVPPRTNTGAKLRLRGKGVPKSKPTDLIVHVEIVLPEASPEVEAAMEALEKAATSNPREALAF